MLVKLKMYKSDELRLTTTVDWEDRSRLSRLAARTRTIVLDRRSQSQSSRGEDEKGVDEHLDQGTLLS